jgi:DNA-binding transcriptional MerR regulator
MTRRTEIGSELTVGQVAERCGVTVRTLHHYDGIGLVVPSGRSRAGYRLYTDSDLTRLQDVVVYRRLGFALADIVALLDDPRADRVVHLRRQRTAVLAQVTRLNELVTALDHALEQVMTDVPDADDSPATQADLRALFGESFDDYQDEARQRWGDTDAWRQSEQRTRHYTRSDWERVKAETDELHNAFLLAFRAGQPATSRAALDAAEAHRQHIDSRFYECSHAMHRQLADLYVSDPRYSATYDESLDAPGLAQYIHDSIHANAERHADGTEATAPRPE